MVFWSTPYVAQRNGETGMGSMQDSVQPESSCPDSTASSNQSQAPEGSSKIPDKVFQSNNTLRHWAQSSLLAQVKVKYRSKGSSKRDHSRRVHPENEGSKNPRQKLSHFFRPSLRNPAALLLSHFTGYKGVTVARPKSKEGELDSTF
ncbi:hypothetical protein mRhiFer1_010187 [Rhinolophus ferrumequinum]|uniref:Uncharacterized protein n=1 Tax=Rhinolophus ferrumequinum TaxID=59479 RepID=A0A7J7XPP3_RHIFE|nr:hypothetical protein mRhiFer1_010187 [Rhinolophus ferrumequinum]